MAIGPRITLVLVAALSACGHGDGEPVVVGGAVEVAPAPESPASPRPPTPPTPEPGPEPAPVGRTVATEAVVRAMKAYPLPAPGFPQPNLFELVPAEPATAAATLYASSRLIVGGEGVMSRLQHRIGGGPFVTLDWFVSSGIDRWYVSQVVVDAGTGEPLRFDGLHVLSASEPPVLDRPLFTWRTDPPAGPAELSLTLVSVADAPDAFGVCWRLRGPAALDRTTCTLHGVPAAARLVVADGGAGPWLLQADTAASPWNPAPPDGVPAPPPETAPIRTIRGSAVAAALRRPAFATFATTGVTSVPLASPTAPGSTLLLTAGTAMSSLPNPYGSWDTTLASTIDGTRAVAVDARVDVLRYGAQLGPVASILDGVPVAIDAGPLPLGETDWLPLDRTVAIGTAADRSVQLVLQSVAGAPDAYRVCWRSVADAVDRLACSVHGVAGETARVTDVAAGASTVWR